MIIKTYTKTGNLIEFDTAKYPTMGEIRKCLDNGGHVAVLYEGDRKTANLVWSGIAGHTQPMKPSTVNDLLKRGIIAPTNWRTGDGWTADYFGPGDGKER